MTMKREIGLVLPDGREAYVFWDTGWAAYGWAIENAFTNGPFADFDEAVNALVDELDALGFETLSRALAGASPPARN